MLGVVAVGDLDLARWRLRTQRLVAPHLSTATDVVALLLAVQAENPSQSAWAVAARTTAPDAGDLARLLHDGAVVRTHVLRPTWHYVAADDVGWLIELTAPRIRRTTQLQLRNVLGMDDRVVARASTAVLDALQSRHLTRSELADELAAAGQAMTGQALMILLAELELQSLVCSGRPADDGTHTYARFDERIPAPRRLDRDDALAEIALRYFTGHGPATERDLAYWGTLTLGDVRTGLAQVADRLESFVHDGRTFWHAAGGPPTAAGDPAGHLLQVLDETYRGYQDSRWVLDAAGVVPRSRETAVGMALVDAQLVAAMKRTVAADRVVFELRPYRSLKAADVETLDAAAGRYGRFLDRAGVLDVR
jgi:winged helix DNA-binding protein